MGRPKKNIENMQPTTPEPVTSENVQNPPLQLEFPENSYKEINSNSKQNLNISIEQCVITEIEKQKQPNGILYSDFSQTTKFNCEPPVAFERNKFGLLTNINYSFNPDGSVNWKAMVPKEYLYLNNSRKASIEKKYGKSIDQIDIEKDNVEDVDLVVKLGGLRFLLKVRGFESVSYDPIKSISENYAATVCTLTLTPNYEQNHFNEKDGKNEMVSYLTYSAIGSACIANTNDMTRTYLIEIAENRAFCRAVRAALNLNIVSQDELPMSKSEAASLFNNTNGSDSAITNTSAASLLNARLKAKNLSFDKLKASMILQAKNDEDKERIRKFNSAEDISKSEIFDILGRMFAKEEREQLKAAQQASQPAA